MKKYIVHLSDEDRTAVRNILCKGRQLASVRKRAHVLLLTGSGMTDTAVAETAFVRVRTVCNIRKAFCEQGLQAALFDRPRPGRPKIFDETDETELAALSCSDPPAGYGRWTLALLGSRTTKPMKKSTVSLLLKKKRLQTLERKDVVHRQADEGILRSHVRAD